MEFFAIENAFMFVNMAPRLENTAILSKETGDIYYISTLGDSDELPDDVHDDEKYIEIPHKNDLDLGINLVMNFVERNLTESLGEVQAFFSKKGAYSRYKSFLTEKGMLDLWHAYEEKMLSTALAEWCRNNGINVHF